MTQSKIEWTDRSDWNPIRGCTRVSPGCGGPGEHGGCYAEAMAARFSDPGQWGHGFAERTAKGGRWTGRVEIQWDRVDLPLRWRQPSLIFASSTSDFFHESLILHDVAHLFGVMIAAHHLRGHRFQVLTKRAARMRRYLCDPTFWEIANSFADGYVMEGTDPLDRRSYDARATCDDYGVDNPPPGLWLGVSVEDQQRADERIPDLLATPAAVRFLSCEPLLGAIDLRWIAEPDEEKCGVIDALLGCNWIEGFGSGVEFRPVRPGHHDRVMTRRVCSPEADILANRKLDWVIAGGESGPKARPMHPDWARSLRDQCQAAGVPFHFKQWGEWLPGQNDLYPKWDGRSVAHWQDGQWGPRKATEKTYVTWEPDGTQHRGLLLNKPYHEVHRWAMRVGKKRAGRLLDGVVHDGFPEVQNG